MSVYARDTRKRKPIKQNLLNIADNERRRIGQDLHDGMGQELAGLAFMADALLEVLQEKLPSEVKLVETLNAGLKGLLNRVRTEAWGLIPMEIEAADLKLALSKLSTQISARFRVQCQFSSETAVVNATKDIATNLYRIAQEAATNAIKHGHATQIAISLHQYFGRTTLEVRDNGQGLPSNVDTDRGLGMRIMQSRAAFINGILDVHQGDEGGVIVTCTVQAKGP